MSVIYSIQAIQIIDSRGTPTVSCKVTLENGICATSMVPSGASTGSREALELRDSNAAYLGKGVNKAVTNIHEIIAPALIGMDVTNQQDIDEKMLVGPAVGDLEGDGIIDIVVVTWDDHIYALDSGGNIKSGFPVLSTNRFNSPATLADLDGNGTLEIIAGNDSGLLHILHHDGTEMSTFDTGDDIRGGISVSDIDNDGSYELLFSGYDDMIHVLNPISGQELEGWPIDMNSNSLSGPVTADLDNDGDLEIVGAIKSGTVYVFHHDGSYFNGFPANVSGTIESTPAIGDLDSDGNYELIFGTTQGLQVFDIKTDKGEMLSWKMHRGNVFRNGTLGLSLLSVNVSTRLKDVTVTLPVFSMVMVYLKTSPGSLLELPLVSVTETVLVTSIDGFGEMMTSVVSSIVLPSLSSPSSEVSDTLLV